MRYGPINFSNIFPDISHSVPFFLPRLYGHTLWFQTSLPLALYRTVSIRSSFLDTFGFRLLPGAAYSSAPVHTHHTVIICLFTLFLIRTSSTGSSRNARHAAVHIGSAFTATSRIKWNCFPMGFIRLSPVDFVHRTKRVLMIFFIFFCLLLPRKFHGLFHPMFLTINIIVARPYPTSTTGYFELKTAWFHFSINISSGHILTVLILPSIPLYMLIHCPDDVICRGSWSFPHVVFSSSYNVASWCVLE